MVGIEINGASFLGGVTRTLNISYLKAIPIGKPLFSYSFRTLTGHGLTEGRDESKDPQRSLPGRQDDGYDPRYHDESRWQDYFLYVRAS